MARYVFSLTDAQLSELVASGQFEEVSFASSNPALVRAIQQWKNVFNKYDKLQPPESHGYYSRMAI